MKKIFALLLSFAVLFSITACGQQTADHSTEDNKTEDHGVEDNKIEDHGTEDNKTVPEFDETDVMFCAQNRCDIEGDKYTLYSYNCKGELLEANDNPNIAPYYGEIGLAPAIHPQSGNIGFVNKEGEFVIEPKYYDASVFSKDGLAPVCVKNEETYDRKWGFVNSKGEEIVPLIYDDVSCFFDSGYAVIAKEDEDNISQYGIIDKNGNVTLEPQYKNIYYIFDQYLFCQLEDGYHAIVDLKGNIIEKEDRYDVGYYFGAKSYKEVGIWKYSRAFNPWPIPSEYLGTFDGKHFVEEKLDYEISSKNVATTATGIGYGVIKNGETVIPFKYDDIRLYNSYFVAIKYLSADGVEQTIDIYDKDFNKTAENIGYTFSDRSNAYGEACMLPDGYFEICVANSDYDWVYGIIDANGNIIVEPVFGRGIKLNTYEGIGKFEWYFADVTISAQYLFS